MSDTLALANGVIIDRQTGQAIAPSVSAEKAARSTKRERRASEVGRDRSNKAVRIGIGELPADPRALTTVGIVWLYYNLGLSDYDIRDATGLTLDQIESIKGLSLFDTLHNRITANISKLGTEDIAARILAMAPAALDEQEKILNDDDVDVNAKIRVTESILDRAGFAPKQIIENQHKVMGGLIIKYVEETSVDPKKMPQINIDRNGAMEIEDA